MKRNEFEKLQIGDIVYIPGSRDYKKPTEVVLIEGDEVVLRCLDEEGFTIGSKTNSKLYATNWRSISYKNSWV